VGSLVTGRYRWCRSIKIGANWHR